MGAELITTSRERLQAAITALEDAHKTWSERVTALHMAEISLRAAQKHMRHAYDVLCETLNHH